MTEHDFGYNPKERPVAALRPVVEGMLKNLDRYIERHRRETDQRTLTESQMTVFEALRDFIANGGTEGYVGLPTGWGKTVLFSELIEATGLKTIIVVPTRILVDQTGERLSEFAEGVDVGKIYSYAKEFDRQVTIITDASLARHIENGTLRPQEYPLLVLDEVHRLLSDKRSEAVRRFTNAIKIGFTATPRFSTDRYVGKLLNTEIHNMTVKEAVGEGLLCPLSAYIAQTEIDLTNVSVTRSGEYDEKELERAINVKARNQSAVELYQKMFDGQRALVYCVGIQHAEEVAKLFIENGVPARHISGKQGRKEQDEIKEQFRSGEIRVLCNADILIEGFDEPRASVCLNLRPTLSWVVAQQRGGRVLRRDPNNPFKHAYVVDFVDQLTNWRNVPVTFAQAAEGALIVEKTPISVLQASDAAQSTGARQRLNIQEVNISGLKVFTDAEEVLRVVADMLSRKYQLAPEGWMHVAQLASVTDFNYRTVLKMIDAHGYRTRNPEWFGKYMGQSFQLSEFYSPDLVRDFISRTEALRPPEGWKSTSTLAALIGFNRSSLRSVIQQYKDEYPTWVRKYHKGYGPNADFIAPELVKIIAQKYQSRRFNLPAPEEWMHTSSVVSLTHRTFGAVKRRVDFHRVSHPESVALYLDRSSQLTEFYSPELVDLLVIELKVPIRPPNGWLSKNALAKELKKAPAFIGKLANNYRRSRLKSFRQYIANNGQMVEWYSPALLKKIRKDVESLKPAPEGWITISKLADLFYQRGDTKRIRNLVSLYIAKHPKWSDYYLDKGARTREFYAPELIQELQDTELRTDWITITKLAGLLHINTYHARKVVKPHIEAHPEWSKERGNRILYSPDLVEQVKKDLGLSESQ